MSVSLVEKEKTKRLSMEDLSRVGAGGSAAGRVGASFS